MPRDFKQIHALSAAIAVLGSIAPMPTPRRMDSETTPREVCEAFDVYFNGIRQLCCKVADVDKGYIVRYKRSIGRKPMTTQTEVLRGKVEIRRKGEARTDGAADRISAGVPHSGPKADDRGEGAGTACVASSAEDAPAK
jgi:hypothetical protein